MDLEKDYLEYVVQFSIAMFAISAAYFFDPFEPWTYFSLAVIPMLFGYTAYISRDSFSESSFLAVATLIFAIVNYKLALAAIVISLGNILVSFFANGSSFKDYYGSTSLPLLFVGIMLGSGLFLLSMSQPGIEDEVRSSASDIVEVKANLVVEGTGLVEGQQELQVRIVEETSRNTVSATHGYVINETGGSVNTEVLEAFDSAQEDIPEMMAEEMEEEMEDEGQVSETLGEMVEQNLRGNYLAVFIPLFALGFYGAQPIVGLSTAFFASVFSVLSTRSEKVVEESGSIKDSHNSSRHDRDQIR